MGDALSRHIIDAEVREDVRRGEPFLHEFAEALLVEVALAEEHRAPDGTRPQQRRIALDGLGRFPDVGVLLLELHRTAVAEGVAATQCQRIYYLPVAIFIYVYARVSYIIGLHCLLWRGGRRLHLQLDEHGGLQGVGAERDVFVALVVVAAFAQGADDARTLRLERDDAEGVAAVQQAAFLKIQLLVFALGRGVSAAFPRTLLPLVALLLCRRFMFLLL